MVSPIEKPLKRIDELNPIWEVITPEERMYLRENTRLQRYKKGDVIYHEGETPHYMVCLINGRVKIYKEGVGGRCQIIRFVKPIENFGYRAAFAQEPYLTSASAIEPTEAYLVPIQVVRQIIQSNNRLATYFIRILARDLGEDDARIVSLTQKHVRGRLAESLLMLYETYGVGTDGAIKCYLSREDLANYANMTTSNAIRTLSNFANEGLISIQRRRLTILDADALDKISKIG